MKELLSYQKHSSQTHLSPLSTSAVGLFPHFILTPIQKITLAKKEQSIYLEYSNQIHVSLHWISSVTTCCFTSFSFNTGNSLDVTGAISMVTYLLLHTSLLNVVNNIDAIGAIKLFEALQSNSSLISLDLESNSFVLHLILTEYR